MLNYHSKKTLLFLGLKYHSNLLSYCSKLPPFQGKFNVINIHMVIEPKMAVNYCSISFTTLAPKAAPCQFQSRIKFSSFFSLKKRSKTSQLIPTVYQGQG